MKTYCITDFGALSNGEMMTDKIQAAIDTCFLDGGGTVVVPQGDFYTGGIRLRSNVTLHLKKNAHLIGSRNPMDYFGIRYDKIEPVAKDEISDIKWVPAPVRTCFDHFNKAASRWNNAFIKAVDAQNITIKGEEGSYIDGRDCFDEEGEEYYRGPHAINFQRCKNIRLEGYTIKNSANYAHVCLYSQNIDIKGVTVEAGHDGVHLRSCTNVSVKDCKLYTGDDCIGGFANLNVVISDCMFNTACSGVRFGGTNVHIKNCKFIGPAKYIFRGSLSDEEKRNGTTSKVNEGHRYNMLSAYTYYSDFTMEIKHTPENIVIENCEIENTDRFLHYNFSGNEPWQCNKPLRSITFKNISAKGIKMPLNMYGSKDMPTVAEFKNVQIEFDKDLKNVPFIRAAWFEKISFDNVTVNNVTDDVLIRTWSEKGEIICNNFVYDKKDAKLCESAKEEFKCDAI